MDTKTYDKGQIIFKAGDIGDAVYKVLNGKVGIYVNYGEPSEKCLVVLEKGKLFGEMALVENAPRSATAVVDEEATLLVVENDSFDEFIQENPYVAFEIMKGLSGRLRAVTIDYMDACKTISEVMDENNKPKKEGLWEKIKKYAKVYAEASAEAYALYDEHGDPKPYYFNSHYPMFY